MKKNLFYQSIYQVLLFILPLITAPYISRVLGPNGVGEYSFTYSVVSIFVIVAKLGIDNYGNRKIAVCKGDANLLRQEFANIYSIHIAVSIITIIGYFIYVYFFANSYKEIFYIQIIVLVAQVFDINWLFFGLEEFKLTATRNMIIRIICTVLVFLLIKERQDVWKYTILLAVASLLSEIIMHYYRIKRFRWVKPQVHAMGSDLKGMLILFIPTIAVSVYKIMDKAMLGYMSETSEVGLYENTEKLIILVLALITALGTVMMPRISNMAAKGETTEIRVIFEKSIKITSIGIAAVMFGLVGISSTFPIVFWGNEFSKCTYILIGLCISLPFTVIANVIRTQYLIPFHHDKIFVISICVGAVLNVIANILLIPLYASIGAVIGTIIAEASVFIVQFCFSNKEIHLIHLLKESGLYFLLGLMMGTAVYAVGYFMYPSVEVLLLQIILGIMIFVTGTVIIANIKNDTVVKEFVRGVLVKLRIKANKAR